MEFLSGGFPEGFLEEVADELDFRSDGGGGLVSGN